MKNSKPIRSIRVLILARHTGEEEDCILYFRILEHHSISNKFKMRYNDALCGK